MLEIMTLDLELDGIISSSLQFFFLMLLLPAYHTKVVSSAWRAPVSPG